MSGPNLYWYSIFFIHLKHIDGMMLLAAERTRQDTMIKQIKDLWWLGERVEAGARWPCAPLQLRRLPLPNNIMKGRSDRRYPSYLILFLIVAGSVVSVSHVIINVLLMYSSCKNVTNFICKPNSSSCVHSVVLFALLYAPLERNKGVVLRPIERYFLNTDHYITSSWR